METIRARGDRPRAISGAARAATEEYLRATNLAYAELVSRLSTAAQALDEGPFPSAAAAHRRLTRQFIDGQRALLRQRATTIAEASEIEDDALAAAEAIVGEAYEAAGIERPPPVDPPAAGHAEFANGDGFAEAVADLQLLLDDWWRSELANSHELLRRATDTAELIRTLARFEAGEVLVEADIPSPLPPPSPALHQRDLLPASVAGTMAAADVSDLLQVCDELLRVLGDERPDIGAALEPQADPWAPPSAGPRCAGPVPDTVELGAPVLLVAEAPEAAVGDAFHRFWGEGPESHRGRRSSIVRQALVSMLAFTGILTAVMALIG